VFRYVASRLLQGLIMVLLVATFVFVLLRWFGSDPASIATLPGASPEVIAQYRASFGLDKPILEQYGGFLANAAVGDFGTSFRVRQSAMLLVLEALVRTGVLVGLALLTSLVLAVVAGLFAARRPGRSVDRISGLVASFLQSIPVFWLGIVLVLVLSVHLSVFPALASLSPTGLVLPVAAIALGLFPEQFRLLRASAAESLAQDYVRSARGFGVPERTILFRYVLKNSVLPLLTVLGIQLGYLLGGAVAVEVVFDYPGIGTLAQKALLSRDFPIMQAVTIVAAASFLVLNLFVDLLYRALNRRVVI
jgi:peptide/nickel transport system permease protein